LNAQGRRPFRPPLHATASWRKLSIFQVQGGRLQQQNVVNVRPGPTAFATNRVIEGSPSSFRIIFSEAMIRNILFLKLSVSQGISTRM